MKKPSHRKGRARSPQHGKDQSDEREKKGPREGGGWVKKKKKGKKEKGRARKTVREWVVRLGTATAAVNQNKGRWEKGKSKSGGVLITRGVSRADL